MNLNRKACQKQAWVFHKNWCNKYEGPSDTSSSSQQQQQSQGQGQANVNAVEGEATSVTAITPAQDVVVENYASSSNQDEPHDSTRTN